MLREQAGAALECLDEQALDLVIHARRARDVPQGVDQRGLVGVLASSLAQLLDEVATPAAANGNNNKNGGARNNNNNNNNSNEQQSTKKLPRILKICFSGPSFSS